jgi:hypothetical protein
MMNEAPQVSVNLYGEEVYLSPELGVYSNARLAITMVNPYTFEQWATVTVNMPNDHLNEGEVFIKDWAENEALVGALLRAGWLVATGRELASGFVFPKVMTLGGDLAEYFKAWKAEES